ncbi:hypothetical protein LINPERPRIM_LOCUS14565 [Linum perenne]
MEYYSKYSYEREVTEENIKENERESVDMMLYAAAAAAGTSTIAMAAWANKLGGIMLIMEQWRVQVFLLLNCLLLAIFLTSLRSSSSSASSIHHNQPHQKSISPEPKSNLEIPSEKRAETAAKVTMDVNEEEDTKEKRGSEVRDLHDDDDDDEQSQSLLLSKEELNERAEAFIAMFREHLVRDAAIEVRDLHFGFNHHRTITC